MKISAYLVRRLLLFVPTLFLLTVGVFVLTRVAGDPAAMYIEPGMGPEQVAKIRERYGLDDPLHVQYLRYVKGLLSGDLGYSRAAGLPIAQALATRLPATFELTLFSMLVAIVAGIRLGAASAVKRDSVLDQFTRVIALGGVSIPVFWLAILLLGLFYAKLGILPIGRYSLDIWPASARHTNFYLIDAIINRSPAQFLDSLKHLLLPALCLGYLQLAMIVRIMRSSMLEVLKEDYIRTARAKGLAESLVIGKHAQRNALLPVTTIAAFSFGTMLTGSILTEKVFNWPGMGLWAVEAILKLDTTSIMGYVTVTGVIYLAANLVADVLYAYLDPRIRLGG